MCSNVLYYCFLIIKFNTIRQMKKHILIKLSSFTLHLLNVRIIRMEKISDNIKAK